MRMNRRLLAVVTGLLPLVGGCALGPAARVTPTERRAAAKVREGDLLRRRGLGTRARAAYESALHIDPDDRRAHAGLQEVALREGFDLDLRREYRKSGRPYLTARLETSPERRRELLDPAPEPWRSIGLGIVASADPDQRDATEAVRSFQRAVDSDPGLSWSRIGLARVLAARGRLGEAELHFRAAHWSDSAHPAPALGLSYLEDRRGHLAEAYRWAVEAYRRAPGDESAAARLANVASRRGSPRYRAKAAQLLGDLGHDANAYALLRAASLWRRTGSAARLPALFARARQLGATEAEIAIAAGRDEPPARSDGVRAFVRTFTRGDEARYRHYSATRQADSLDALVSWARDLWERSTGEVLGPPGGRQRIAFIGSLVDPRRASAEPLVQACARHGLVLVLGQRRGGPPEAMLADEVRRETDRRVPLRGTTVRAEAIWIGRRHLSGYLEWAGGGDIAGVALGDVVLIDLHAVAHWEGDIARRLHKRKAPLTAPALLDEDVRAIDDPAGVADRLYRLGPIDLAQEVRVHEDAHAVDAARHLPVAKHPLRNLKLVVLRGFDADHVVAFLERNAQLTAIAEGPSPRAALATCCATLTRRRGGVHATGYREIVAAFVREIAAHPARYPEIDATRVIVQQLHRLPPEKIRAIAVALLDRWGLT